MPLPPATVSRARKHQRSITFEGFRRDDGLWDIEGRLIDAKDKDLDLPRGVRRRGEPIHDIGVRVTIDRAMTVVDIAVSANHTPFPDVCDRIVPDYRQIVGMNLLKGFLRSIKTLFGGTRGCTHVSELLMALPSAAFQTFAGDVEPGEEKPFHLDRCHALSTDSETVERYYPRWYRKTED
jgi:hypothetical protein